MEENGMSSQEKEAIKSLRNDFNQCFQQMRHYDTQIVSIFKYLATFYTTIAGITVGLHRLSLDKNIQLTSSLIVGLSIGLMFGISMFFLIVRNRVYFVYCAQYINEQRRLFLSYKPLGFENKTGMYTNPSQPPFFNWQSSQSWWMYLIAFLNACLFGTILFLGKQHISILIMGLTLLFSAQLIASIVYLHKRENKSASKSIFGKE